MSTTVNWVQDVNGNYEVSSPEHLKQLMHKGTLYTDSGTPPSNYWGPNTNIVSYIQTANIDLLNDSTDIKPIGVNADDFYGSYNGSNYTISNWSYIDPEFTTSNTCASRVGLFGELGISSQPCILKNIRLGGVWNAQGFSQYVGFLLALDFASYQNEIMNIEVDLEAGSYLTAKSGDIPEFIGGVFGYFRGGSMTGVTLKGILDLGLSTGEFVGGVCGGRDANGSYETSLIQNLATFPSGITATRFAGGVFGFCSSPNTTKIINAMNGDINSSEYAGGIVGFGSVRTSCHTIVNAMTGNITNTGIEGTGGVFGRCTSTVTCLYFINYMTGNISISGGGTTKIGGIAGYFLGNGAALANSINAMNGSVYESVVGLTSSVNVVATVNTSFGLTFTTDNYGRSLAPGGLLTDSGFPELPYATLDGTDSDGNSYDFDFVFANLSGNSSYSSYTHLVLHKGDVETPFRIDFDVPDTNTTLYLTFINGNTLTFLQPNLSTALSPGTFSVIPRSINIIVNIGEVPGATGYRITYESNTGGGEVISFSGYTDTSYNIINLEPDTQYTIRMYTNTGNGYVLNGNEVTSTLANTSTSYDVTDFQENGIFDISVFKNSSRGDLSSVIGNLFNTGDIIRVNSNITSNLDTSFIKLGETLSIKDINGVLIPFDQTSGSGQNVNVTLSDDVTNVPITFDENTNSVSVNSSSYSVGSSFILDGKKVKIIDY